MKRPIGWREKGLGSLKTEWSHLGALEEASHGSCCGHSLVWTARPRSMSGCRRQLSQEALCPVNFLVKSAPVCQDVDVFEIG